MDPRTRHQFAAVTILALALSSHAAAGGLPGLGDDSAEGVLGSTISLGQLGQVDSLDQGLGTAPDAFCVDEAYATLGGHGVFVAPNVISFGAFLPGPTAQLGPCLSFHVALGSNQHGVGVVLLVSQQDAGNVITVDGLAGGIVVATSQVTISAGAGIQSIELSVAAPNPSGTLDEILLHGSGPLNGGAFHGALETLDFGGVCSGCGAFFCDGSGIGSQTACPCGNASAFLDHVGCLNSFGVGGWLGVTGAASLSNDTVVLYGAQMPNSSALFFQGTSLQNNGNGSVFGDGLRCAGGSIVRLGTQQNANGASRYPGAGDPSISVRGLVTSPGTRTYQIWYRNSAAFCTSSGFNLSNGVAFVWVP